MLICDKCGKTITSYFADRHLYIYDKTKDMVVEICKKCMDKKRVRRMFVKVQGKTRVID